MARIKASEREEILQNTRELLLQAAAISFANEGFDAANINKISMDAGFAKGTIYNYFTGKKELLLALIDEVSTTHCQTMIAQMRSCSNSTQKIHLLFLSGFEYVKLNIAKMRAILNIFFGHDVELKTRLFMAYQPLITYVKDEILKPGIKAHEFKPTEINETSLLILSLYMGLSTQADAEGNIWISAEQAANFALNGLSMQRGN